MRLLPSSGSRPGRVLAGLTGVAVIVALVAALATVLWLLPDSGRTVTGGGVAARDTSAGDRPSSSPTTETTTEARTVDR